MFRYNVGAAPVQRNQYRNGRKGLQAWVSLALYGQVKALAAAQETTMQDFIIEALREKVNRDAGDAGRRDGRSAEADGSRSRHPSVRGGEGAARVGAGDVADPVEPWDAAENRGFTEATDLFDAMFGEPKPPVLRLVEELA